VPRFRFLLISALALTAVAAVAAGAATSAPRVQYQVAVLFPGTSNDGSWGQAWSEGANAGAKKYKAKVTLVGNLNTPDQYLAQASAFASKGYNLVIIANGGVGNADLEAAQHFPKTKFVQAPFQFPNAAAAEKRGEPTNLGHIDAEQQQGAFLAGVLAGLITKTNKVASVNGYAFPALTRQPEAFSLGARCVNSKVSFTQKYINSWDDTALAKAAAQAFISNGADVLFSATDQASQGMFQAAEAAPRPTYVIPSYFDSHSQAPKVVLTSVLYNLQGVAEDLIGLGVKGKIGSHFTKDYTYKNIGVGKLAPFYNLASAVPASAKAELNAVLQKVLSGKIKIPDETLGSPTIGAPNTAAKIDVKSLGCNPK
jgi:basic membrane protein A and related proteins